MSQILVRSRSAGAVQRMRISAIPAVNQLSDVFMFDQFAAICGGDALFHFLREPLVVVHHAFDRFHHQRFAIAALLGGKLSQLGLQIRFEANFHGSRLGFAQHGVTDV